MPEYVHSLKVAVCKMERTRRGGLKKSGDYVEVTYNRDDNYQQCVEKAVIALGWEYNVDDGCPCLCRTSGCRIVDQPIINDVGVQKAWTILSYINSVFSKNSHVKLGVALFEVNQSCKIYLA